MNWYMLGKIDDITERQKQLGEQVQSKALDGSKNLHEEALAVRAQVNLLRETLLKEQEARKAAEAKAAEAASSLSED